MEEIKKRFRLCFVKCKDKRLENCLFHRWVDKCEIIGPSVMVGGHNGGELRFCVALYETEDGEIQECLPNDITFTDNTMSKLLETTSNACIVLDKFSKELEKGTQNFSELEIAGENSLGIEKRLKMIARAVEGMGEFEVGLIIKEIERQFKIEKNGVKLPTAANIEKGMRWRWRADTKMFEGIKEKYGVIPDDKKEPTKK